MNIVNVKMCMLNSKPDMGDQFIPGFDFKQNAKSKSCLGKNKGFA